MILALVQNLKKKTILIFTILNVEIFSNSINIRPLKGSVLPTLNPLSLPLFPLLNNLSCLPKNLSPNYIHEAFKAFIYSGSSYLCLRSFIKTSGQLALQFSPFKRAPETHPHHDIHSQRFTYRRSPHWGPPSRSRPSRALLTNRSFETNFFTSTRFKLRRKKGERKKKGSGNETFP